MFKNQGRRAMDRFPFSQRMAWAGWRLMNDVKRHGATVVGICAIGAFYAFAGYVVLGWLGGR